MTRCLSCPGSVRAIGFRNPAKHLLLVTSIESNTYDGLFSCPRHAELHPFVELTGDPAPVTPGVLLFHIRAETMDLCLKLAGRVLKSMPGAFTVFDEIHGFQFFDNRDLLGFVDSTEHRYDAIVTIASAIGDEDPDFTDSC